MIVVFGIDPGIARTGYGVIAADSSRYRHITHGTIETGAELEYGARLESIFLELTALLREHKPDIAGIEALYFARNASSAIPVAQAKGVILLALQRSGIPVREYPPQEIKRAISGSGRAEKQQVQERVRVLPGLAEVPRPEHGADALAAAICCFNHHDAEMRIGARDD